MVIGASSDCGSCGERGNKFKKRGRNQSKPPICLPLAVTAIEVVNGHLFVSPGNSNLCNLKK